ncbi:MAG: hypothetical protein EPO13_10095 [Actinomycetota bacterium]|nr:MAG: hypothetical protein EPO13_10095 [Actinomycetota bacterium]
MTGVIYVAIFALWLVVLVPMWLRRHDEADVVRTADRFNHAMRSLSRRSSSPYGEPREVVVPQRSREVRVAVSGTGSRVADPADRRATAQRPQPARSDRSVRATASAARRRRRVVALLLAAAAVLGVLAVQGRAPVWTPAVPVVLVIVVLALGVRQVRSARERAKRRARLEESSRRGRAATYRAMEDVARGVRSGIATTAAGTAAATGQATGTDDEAWVQPAWTENGWEAVPTTLPTYVTAPRATPVPRTIDLKRPGQWTSAAMLEEAERERRQVSFQERFVADTAALDFLDDEDDLASFVDPPGRSRDGVVRRAVNE